MVRGGSATGRCAYTKAQAVICNHRLVRTARNLAGNRLQEGKGFLVDRMMTWLETHEFSRSIVMYCGIMILLFSIETLCLRNRLLNKNELYLAEFRLEEHSQTLRNHLHIILSKNLLILPKDANTKSSPRLEIFLIAYKLEVQ
jgi:hypothetical protein